MNIKKYMPAVLISDLDRVGYQRFLNKYAKDHVKSTVIKFNNHIRASLKDAVEEGLIPYSYIVIIESIILFASAEVFLPFKIKDK
ncbi:hypothetical protein EfmJHP36_11360 [Enterococcus faecium]|nr:hypothetical protein EfmJHP36_11360 [Enterococcus faecium]